MAPVGRRFLEGKVRCTRTADVEPGPLDVLTNREKPAETETASPPNEVLSSIRETFQIDSLNVTNGRLKYGERYEAGSKPAVIKLEETQLSAAWIEGNADGGDTANLQGEGKLVKAGTLNVRTSLPS